MGRSVWRGGHKVTNSPRWKQFNWKLKMRYFLELLSFYENMAKVKQICAAGIVNRLETLHILGLKSWWEGIHTVIFAILSTNLTQAPYITGAIPDGSMEKNNKRLLYHCHPLYISGNTSLWQMNVMKVYWLEKKKQQKDRHVFKPVGSCCLLDYQCDKTDLFVNLVKTVICFF